jgi:hypothetical protein
MHLEASDIVLGVGVSTTVGLAVSYQAGSGVRLRRVIEWGVYTAVVSLTRRRSDCDVGAATATHADPTSTRLARATRRDPWRCWRGLMGIRGEDHPRRGNQQAGADGKRDYQVFHLCTPFQGYVAHWKNRAESSDR